MTEIVVNLAIAVLVEALIVWWAVVWWRRRKQRLEWERKREDMRIGIMLLEARRKNRSKQKG